MILKKSNKGLDGVDDFDYTVHVTSETMECCCRCANNLTFLRRFFLQMRWPVAPINFVTVCFDSLFFFPGARMTYDIDSVAAVNVLLWLAKSSKIKK